MVNYYKSLFASMGGKVSIGILDCVPTMIDEEMNEILCREFEASEVATTLQQMAPLKAPGSTNRMVCLRSFINIFGAR